MMSRIELTRAVHTPASIKANESRVRDLLLPGFIIYIYALAAAGVL
jgi:hypothetical protein